MSSKENFINFMKEYITFFDNMIEVQKTQLEAVLSKRVKLVEKSVSSLQTLLMKLDGMEKKRMELQVQAGYGEMTFRQIIDTEEEPQKQCLKDLFETMEKKVADVAYYNAKSQEKVKLDLKLWENNFSKAKPTPSVGGYTANKKQVDSGNQSSLFEIKA